MEKTALRLTRAAAALTARLAVALPAAPSPCVGYAALRTVAYRRLAAAIAAVRVRRAYALRAARRARYLAARTPTAALAVPAARAATRYAVAVGAYRVSARPVTGYGPYGTDTR
jgi:hypothetical protein